MCVSCFNVYFLFFLSHDKFQMTVPTTNLITSVFNQGIALSNKTTRAKKAAARVGGVAITLSADGREASITGTPDAVQMALGDLTHACHKRGCQTLAKSWTPGNEIAVLPKHPENPLNPANGITHTTLLIRGHDPEAARRWKAWANKTLLHY